MAKTLVIAEKPSVAADIARALGKVPKKGEVFENDEYVISSAVGHLVELEMPEDIDEKKYRFWRLETLPIIPGKFGVKPIEKTKERFQLLKKLLARADVATVLNACDAGREGELIFGYILQAAKCKKPVQRLWMSSMTNDGIRTAFTKLRAGAELQPLQDAARCRSEADWLIGLNGTRAVTKRLFGSRKGSMATVGRVQTPTLAIVMQREREIRAFTSRAFHRVVATFRIAAGEYEGTYEKPDFRKGGDEHDRAERLWQRAAAEAVAAATAPGAQAAVSDESKRTTQISPRLYDLTSLQRDANNRFSFSARRTLQIAQGLYERHKMITYPRTDSRALPEDYVPTVNATLARLHGDLAPHAETVLKNGWVRPNKRIFNNAEVTDHFAIIPTNEEHGHLDADEQKIFDLIARRFVAIFFPPAQIDVTTRTSKVGPHTFRSEGKVLVDPGYLAVAGKTGFEDGAKSLPALTAPDGQPPHAAVTKVDVTDEATKPPPRYTEATLLSAMENAGKLVDDEDLADAMSERGLGTPATRAATIEHLIGENYISREGRELIPTTKAETVLDFLGLTKCDELTSPALTGEWEFRLRKVEQAKLSRETFMESITDLTKKIVANIKEHEETGAPTDALSPSDGQPLLEFSRWWQSQDEALRIYKVMNNRRFSLAEAKALIAHKEIGPFDDFVSEKTGKRFTAKIVLAQDGETGKWKASLDLGNKVEIADLVPVWKSETSGRELCETATHFICRQPVATGGFEEVFRVGRLLCRKELPREQIVKIAEAGKTDLFEDFISRFNRPFSAFLTLDPKEENPGRRIRFEFPPRKPRAEGEGGKGGRKPRTPVDLTGAVAIGKSETHGGADILQVGDHYYVTKPGAEAPRIVFKMAREICKKEISPSEVVQLLANGRTELIEGFTSKRGSAFAAHLVLAKKKDRSEFEFPER
ncbi:MAG TPA: DNA topoisomerase 3 [Opitutaceae bacterium]|nr:DNA topoisomerase 3 [Opitutaceae bacterium]